MMCVQPVSIKNPRLEAGTYNTNEDEYSFLVDCGKCYNCVSNKSWEWVFRLQEHQQTSKNANFLTLTYKPEAVPMSKNGLMTLNYDHHRDFMKRLRTHLYDKYDFRPQENDDHKLKYYAVGEYGTESQRPHYHSILFNLPTDFKNETLSEIWEQGYTRLDPCDGGAIRYVTTYLQTPISRIGKNGDDRKKEDSRTSQGLGKGYLTDGIVSYYKKQLIPYIKTKGGIKTRMPRYYKEKIYTPTELEIVAQKASEHAINESMYDKYTSEFMIEYKKDLRRKMLKLDKANRNKI